MNDVEDISKNFSINVWELFDKAFKFAYENKCSELSLEIFIHVLLNNKNTQNYFDDSKKILILKNLKLESQKNFKNIVSINLDLYKFLLFCYLVAQKNGLEVVDIDQIVLGFLNYPKFATLISNVQISTHFVNKTSNPDSQIDKLFTNLSQVEKLEKNEIIGRFDEISKIIRFLSKENSKNILLVGQYGVGKYSIIRGVIRYINNNQIDNLGNRQFYRLLPDNFSISNERSEQMWDILDNSDRSNIYVINGLSDFVTRLDNISKTNFYNRVMNSSLHIIATENYLTYMKFVTSEVNFLNSFDILQIDEPKIDDTQQILKDASKRLELYHKVKFDDQAIVSSILSSQKYIHDYFLPLKAINILDEASINSKNKVVTENDVLQIISQKTGIPLEKINEQEKQSLNSLEDTLAASVISQDEAIHKVSEVIRRSRAGLKDPKKPIGSFLFLGPSGVGKTELAKVISKTIFNNDKALLRLDMSEFSEPHTVQRLIGSPPGYVGYDEGGQLTNPIIERPYSLILLDEVEKAHPKIFDIFLQVLDDGRLTDGKGRVVDFKNTIIIMTSNLGAELINTDTTPVNNFGNAFLAVIGLSNVKKEMVENIINPSPSDEFLVNYLKRFFRVEFINRFDEIILFNPLSKKSLTKILEIRFKMLETKLADKNIKIKLLDSTKSKIVNDSYNPSLGARPLNRIFQEKIENIIANRIISGGVTNGDVIEI